MLIFVLFLVLFAEFVNGWTDAPNAIATVVSTRTLSFRMAILLATILNVIGAFFGAAVAFTIGEDIINSDVLTLNTLCAAMIAVILWSFFAWKYGIPTSETHALVAALSGAGLAIGGPQAIMWEGWHKIILGLLFSTFLGTLGGYLLTKIIRFCFSNISPEKGRKYFGKVQIFSSAFMAFSHGSNDGQKFIGAFTLALLIGGSIEVFAVPFWVIILCALTMGLGTTVGGLRIIRTMGIKLVKLESYQGFSAETAAGAIISLASYLGIPLSTTHTISTSIVGVGLASRMRSVRWKIFIKIVYAWLFTFPICAIIAYFITWVMKQF